MALCFTLSVLAGGLATGALLVQQVLDWRVANEPPVIQAQSLGIAIAISLLIAVLSGIALLRSLYRPALWAAFTAILSVCVAVVTGELILRTQVPGWPARALHGVRPEQWSAAVTSLDLGNERPHFNSWGQRDHERRRYPMPGMRRIAFIGDSFLEEGASVTISLATESQIDRDNVEIINLGVSATGPDEYFERLRGVAHPLGASHCCWFIYAGNDFVSPIRTLPTYFYLASVAPRPALLTSLGLDSWNHILTNSQRPVIQTWLHGATLAAEEESRAAALKQASNPDIRAMLASAAGFTGDAAARLKAKLNRQEAVPFFNILRKPDNHRFRSYYLGDALRAAADETFQWELNSESNAWQWTQLAAKFCGQHGLGFTIVVIPEGFQADDRMRDQWLPLADMRRVTTPSREAAEKFVRRARDADLDVVDLQAELRGTRGTYLNLDGHWSAVGIEKVAAILARHLEPTTTGSQPSKKPATGQSDASASEPRQ